MYPDPLEPVDGGREQLSNDELRAGAELYAATRPRAWGRRLALLVALGLGSVGTLRLARSYQRSDRARAR